MRAYTIELRVDDTDGERNDIMTNAVKDAAKMLVTQAMLLSRKREPQIHVTMSDAVSGTEILDIKAD
jgi:hypothetical protein